FLKEIPSCSAQRPGTLKPAPVQGPVDAKRLTAGLGDAKSVSCLHCDPGVLAGPGGHECHVPSPEQRKQRRRHRAAGLVVRVPRKQVGELIYLAAERATSALSGSDVSPDLSPCHNGGIRWKAEEDFILLRE